MCVCPNLNIYSDICIHTHTHAYTHTHLHAYTHTHTYMHTHTHTRTFICKSYIHVYTNILFSLRLARQDDYQYGRDVHTQPNTHTGDKFTHNRTHKHTNTHVNLHVNRTQLCKYIHIVHISSLPKYIASKNIYIYIYILLISCASQARGLFTNTYTHTHTYMYM